MKRTILHAPDPRLREVAAPVVAFDGDLKALLQDMADTMCAAGGIGLAAPQIGVSQQVIVLDISGSRQRQGLRIFINPRLHKGKGRIRIREGCLSVPGEEAQPWRHERIEVHAQDEQGRAFRLKADGLLAICIQHECDHLRGVLMVDAQDEASTPVASG